DICGPFSQGCRVRRQNPQRRPARRFAGRAANSFPTGHQYENRQCAWHYCAANAARARRRGDRMTRHLPPPWRADKFSGGYVVRDANGFAVAYVYGRSTEAEAMEAKQMTMDEARRVASNIAKLPEMLKRGNSIN